MEALLKLPENWHVVVTEENKEVLSNWLYSHYESVRLEDRSLIFEVVYKDKDKGKPMQGTIKDNSTEISTADFKRLVLGERNFEDYGVVGCYELINYILQDVGLEAKGSYGNRLYFFKEFWYSESPYKNNRQTLPLQEYLKLLPTGKTETMRNKYEYKVKDKKFNSAISILIKEDYIGRNLDTDKDRIAILNLAVTNTLDLFFDKVEVSFTSMTSIIKGKLTIQLHPTSQVENLKSNGWKITTEDHVNQIRKYLNK